MSNEFAFYRIIHSSSSLDQYLRLPQVFVQKFGADLSDAAVLQVPDGKNWSIELRKTNGNILLHNGWPEFVQYYSISIGHFLVFKYSGKSVFRTLIFDMTGSEIKYPGTEANAAKNMSATLQDINVAHALSSELKLQNPFFKVVMRSSYVTSSSYLVMPLSFAKRYLQGCLHSLTLELSADECKGRRWNVGFLLYIKSRARLSRGWPTFAKENRLKEGDVCVFEMIKKDLFKVHIYRNSIDVMPKVLTMDDLAEEEKSSFVFKESRNTEAPKGLKLKHPSFTVRMKSYYVQHPRSLLKLDFAKRHLNDASGIATLQVSGRGSWHVKYMVYKQRYGQFRAGWATFARENNLNEGDVCVFELIKKEQVVFQVHIFPRNEIDVC